MYYETITNIKGVWQLMRFEIARGGSGLTYEIRNIQLIANKA